MAPLCSDPRQVVISLPPDQRKLLQELVEQIISFITAEVCGLGGSAAGQVSSPSQDKHSSTDTPHESGTESWKSKIHHSFHKSERLESDEHDVSSEIEAAQKATENLDEKAAHIQKAAQNHINEWRKEFLTKLREIVKVEDNAKIEAERQSRRDALAKVEATPSAQGEKSTQTDQTGNDEFKDLELLQKSYPFMDNKLKILAQHDREEIVSCILLLLLSTGKYSAYSRTLALYLAFALRVSSPFLSKEEAEIAQSLIQNSTADKGEKEAMSAEAETAKRQHENKFSRFWKVGLASVAGAAVIGVTGGLAAPLVAGALGGILGGVGLGGVASFLGVFWMNGALVGALFGAYGAKMTGEMMDNYAKEVEDFSFLPLHEETQGNDNSKKSDKLDKSKKAEENHEHRRLRVTIGVNGWLHAEDDVKQPWKVLNSDTEVFALRYEMETLLALGTALKDLVTSFAWQTFKREIIKRTVLATLFAALWPIQVIKLASNVDNPFSRASHRSRKAGRILADALINKVQGERPVTLVGYSLGACAIHACLQSLAEREAFGLIDTVVIIGTPAPSASPHWQTLRTVVSGNIYNVYSENDMVLGFVYRMHSLALGVAGLQAIEDVGGIRNLDLSDAVSGHLRYPELIGAILDKCGFIGVKVDQAIEEDEVIKQKRDYATGKITDDDLSQSTETQEEMKKKTTGPVTQAPSTAASVTDAADRSKTQGDEPATTGIKLPPRPDEIDALETEKPTALPIRSSQPAKEKSEGEQLGYDAPIRMMDDSDDNHT